MVKNRQSVTPEDSEVASRLESYTVFIFFIGIIFKNVIPTFNITLFYILFIVSSSEEHLLTGTLLS